MTRFNYFAIVRSTDVDVPEGQPLRLWTAYSLKDRSGEVLIIAIWPSDYYFAGVVKYRNPSR